MLLFCVRVRVFLAQKKTPKYENSEQNKPYYLHALLPNKARWCILHVWFENATTFTRQHPSIHPSDDDALLLLPDRNADHHRRCKTLERERERDNLLIVQRRRERKNFEEKKKGGNFVLRTIKMHSRHRVVQTRDDFDNATTTREQQGFRGATKTDPSSFRSFAEQMTTTTTTRGLTTKQKLLGPTLLLVGTISLTVFFLVQFGAIELHEKDETRGTKAATFVIGVLSFLPGAYATTVLVQVRRGAEGWSYEMLRDT